MNQDQWKTLDEFKRVINRVVEENDRLVEEARRRSHHRILVRGPDTTPTFREMPRCPE
jgi:hypothetical protein